MSIVKWAWNFGDGSVSSEASPRHVYTAPGIYTVTLTVTDDLGDTYTTTKENYIFVYDYPVGAEGLLSGYTDFCFKHAVKNTQGTGISPITGKWVWPMLIASVAKGYDANHNNLSLIVNADDMKIYQIGVPECWTDRAGTYEESEIACEAFLPEIIPRFGEQETVRHSETHIAMRSWDEKRYRGATGYTADGFRVAQIFGLEIYKDGEQNTPTSSLSQINKDGDLAFLKDIEGKRFQLKVKYAASAFRTVRITTHLQDLDHRTPPSANDVPEKQWQKQFSMMDIWFCRNKPTANTNRGDGLVWSGTTTPMTGPDGKSSAFSSSGLSGQAGYTTNDFTISAWLIGDGHVFQSKVNGGGNFAITLTSGILYISDGLVSLSVNLGLKTSWRYVSVVRSAGTLYVYDNGVLKYTTYLGVLAYGGDTTVGNGTMFDIRRIPIAISGAAIYYYYSSILSGGQEFLP